VEIPDLEGCYADGGDLEDALQSAREAAEEWIRIEMEEFEGDLPFSSLPEELKLEEGQFVRMLMLTIRLLPDND
jgi:predicted RNase H-like HicB family nuclease